MAGEAAVSAVLSVVVEFDEVVLCGYNVPFKDFSIRFKIGLEIFVPV